MHEERGAGKLESRQPAGDGKRAARGRRTLT